MVGELLTEEEVRVEVRANRTKCAELFSAFECGEVLTYSLCLSENRTPDAASMCLWRDEDGRELVFNGERSGNRFRFVIDTADICAEGYGRGLFYYIFRLGDKVLSQNEFGKGYVLCRGDEECSRFQLSVYEKGTNRPTGYEGGVMYQIFPDRFARGKGAPVKENAVLEPWDEPISEYPAHPGDPIKNNHFYGGTLWGVADKLEYLKSLGVTLLYLNPIFRSSSNHRYDVGDYGHIDEMLGGDEAFSYLLEEASKWNIGVILDGVFNHTGADSLYFNKEGTYKTLGAFQSKDSPFYDWYFFKNYPSVYECWWGVTILPKVNCANASFREYIAGKDGIIDRYMAMGIAGWRLDVADELSDEMLDEIRKRTKERKDNALIYGEVWEDASNKIAYSRRRHYFTGGQMNGVMNYPLKNAIIAYLTEKDAEFLFYTMKILYGHYPKAVSDMQMNILSTHDTERILTVLAGAPDGTKDNSVVAHSKLSPQERALGKSRLKLALLLQMFLPGIPCIYYGDEVGMEGYRDPFNRQPYPWGREDRELLAYYRQVAAMRTSLKMLSGAFYRGICCEKGIFAFERFNEEQCLTVVENLSGEEYVYRLSKDEICMFMTFPNGKCEDKEGLPKIFDGTPGQDQGESGEISIPEGAGAIFLKNISSI